MHVTNPISTSDKFNGGWGNDVLDPSTLKMDRWSPTSYAESSAFIPSECRQLSLGNIQHRLAWRSEIINSLVGSNDDYRYRLWLELHSFPANERLHPKNLESIWKVVEGDLDEKLRLMQEHNYDTMSN